jgi:hypothetical protein
MPTSQVFQNFDPSKPKILTMLEVDFITNPKNPPLCKAIEGIP